MDKEKRRKNKDARRLAIKIYNKFVKPNVRNIVTRKVIRNLIVGIVQFIYNFKK